MTNRITDKMLEARIDYLNKITGSPAEPYTNRAANVGNFHLSHAYGGVCLYRMFNAAGGISTPLVNYHTTKRELMDMLNSFISGIEFNGADA